MDIWYLNITDTSLMLLVTHVYEKLSDNYFVIFLILQVLWDNKSY